MVFLAATLTSLLAAGILVLAAVLGAAVAYFYAQARRREAAEVEREERALRQREAELSLIRQRLEEIYERQQTGTQTQFARVNQELEELQTSLDTKGRQIDGVQGQLRYELKRHEEEIAALRSQLREAIEVFAAAALPASQAGVPALNAAPEPTPAAEAKPPARTEPAPAAPETQASAPEPPAFAPLTEFLKDDTELLDDMFGGTDLDSADDEDAAPGTERGFKARPLVDLPEPNDDFEFVEVAPSASTAGSEIRWSSLQSAHPGSFEGSSSTDAAPEPISYSGDGMHDADAFTAEPAESPAPGSEPAPSTGAPDFEDLTALSVVDAQIQQQLYALGVTSVEAIARWSRADARRIAGRLGSTSEEEIMDRWVFEAQAVLFERYQAELRTQREQRLASAG